MYCRRHTDGIVVYLASQEQAQLFLDILNGHFTAHKPVITRDSDPIADLTHAVPEDAIEEDAVLSGVDVSNMTYEEVEAAVRAKAGGTNTSIPSLSSTSAVAKGSADGESNHKTVAAMANTANSSSFRAAEVTMELTRQSRVMSDAPPRLALPHSPSQSMPTPSTEDAAVVESLLPAQKPQSSSSKGILSSIITITIITLCSIAVLSCYDFYSYFGLLASWMSTVPRGAVIEEQTFELDQFPVRYRGKGGVARLTEEEKLERMSISGRKSEYIQRCKCLFIIQIKYDLMYAKIHIYMCTYLCMSRCGWIAGDLTESAIANK